MIAFFRSNRTAAGTYDWLGNLFAGVSGTGSLICGWTSICDENFTASIGLLCAVILITGVCFEHWKDEKTLAAAAAICMLFALCPLAQDALIGFGNSDYQRFWYIIALVWGLVVARCWPKLFCLSLLQLSFAGVSVLFCFFVWLAMERPEGTLSGLLWASALWLTLVLASQHGRLLHRIFSFRVSAFLIAVLTAFQLALGMYNRAADVCDSYRDSRFASQMPAVTAESLPNDSIYRTDTSDIGLNRWWAAANAPLAGEYKGLSEYFSILDKNYADTINADWCLSSASQGIFTFLGLDSCAALNTLASVRYSFVRDNEQNYVPWGYTLVGDTQQSRYFTFTPDNGSVLHRYENNYTLPIGYGYNGVISRQTYNSLNALQKQAAMMQGCVLESLPDGIKEIEPEFSSVVKQEYTMHMAENAIWQDGVLAAGTDDSAFTFNFACDGSTEMHLRLVGLGQTDKEKNGKCIVCLDDGESKEVHVQDSVLAGSDAWINLGTPTAGTHTVKLFISDVLSVKLQTMELWGYDMNIYAQNAEKLSKNGLQNVAEGVNTVAGLLTEDEDTMLCLSIPYSTGWHAVIDGMPAELYRANSLYMALKVPAGEHVITLTYITPGLKRGVCLSAGGVVLLLAELIFYLWKKYSPKKRKVLTT